MHPLWVTPFLQAFAIDGNVSRAARVAGVSSTTVYARKRQDADFAAAWATAFEDAGDNLIAEARHRAVDGVDETVIYQGQPTPIFERDEDGEIALYQAGEDKDGKPIMRPRQARDADGNLVWLTVKKKSDPLLTLLLKGFKKGMFADRTELTGRDGDPIAMDDGARVARIAQLMAVAKQRAEAPPPADHSDLA